MENAAVKTTTGAVQTESPGLFANRKFMRLWLSSIFTGLSLSVYMLAETWYVVDHLGMSAMLGIVLMATTLPRVFLMMFGGVMADRVNPSTIMFLSNSLRGVMLAVMIIALVSDMLNISMLFIFAFIFGVLDAFFWPANGSIIPSIVDKSQLTRANSIIQTTSNVTFITGPIIAGWLLAVSSFSILFGFVGLLLIASGLTIYKVKSERNESKPDGSTWDNLKEGLTYVKKSPLLLSSMFMGIIINLCLTGPGTLAGPIIVSESLKGDALQLSYVESAIAIGMVVGGLVVAVWNPTKKRGIISLARIFILGIVFILFSQVTALWQCIVIAASIGFLITAGDLPMRSLIQESTDPDKMGRVSGINSSIGSGLVPVSFALTSVALSADISIYNILMFCGIGLSLYTVFGFWKFKALREAE